MDPFVMAEKVENVDAAWEVMKFLAGYETQKWNYEIFKATPTLVDADFVATRKTNWLETAMEIADVSPSVMMDEANPFFGSEIALRPLMCFVSNAAKNKAPDIDKFLGDFTKTR